MRAAQVASMAASMERNKAAAREEVEAERQAAERTRESLEAAQVKTLTGWWLGAFFLRLLWLM